MLEAAAGLAAVKATELARTEPLPMDVMLMCGSFIVLSQKDMEEDQSQMTWKGIGSFIRAVNLREYLSAMYRPDRLYH